MFLTKLYDYLQTQFSNVMTMLSNMEQRVDHTYDRTSLLRDNIARVDERVMVLTKMVQELMLTRPVNVTNEVWTPPSDVAPEVTTPLLTARVEALEKHLIMLAEQLRDAVAANAKGFQGMEAHVEDSDDMFEAVEEDVVELFASINEIRAALALSGVSITSLNSRIRQMEDELEFDGSATTLTDAEKTSNAVLMQKAVEASNAAADYRSADNPLVGAIRETYGDEGVDAFVAAGGKLHGDDEPVEVEEFGQFLKSLVEDMIDTVDEEDDDEDDGPFPILVTMARKATPESKEVLIEDLVGLLMEVRANDYIDDDLLAQGAALLTGDHDNYGQEFSADVRTNLLVIGEVETMFDDDGNGMSGQITITNPIDVISMVWAVFVNECLRNDW